MRSTAQFESSSDVISLVTVAGNLVYASRSSAKLFGYLPQEVIGRNPLDLIHPEDRRSARHALLAVLAAPDEPRRIEVRVRRQDGEWCVVESTISNHLDEPRIGAILINCREIGARREHDQRRIDELARCNKQLEDCAFAVAHDFREPLRTISMFTSLLLKTANLDAKAKLLAQHIVDGTTRMGALFEGLHSLAITRVDDPPRPFNLNMAVVDALEDLGHAITTSGAIVTVDPLPIVLGHERHLLRVFQNLITNAIKYHSHEPIRIHVTAESAGAQWIIRVKDNGIGIDLKHHESIFVLLKRLHGQDVPGAGIGLAICKKIIEEMGGAIWVESEPGRGSTFCFTIAAAEQHMVRPYLNGAPAKELQHTANAS